MGYTGRAIGCFLLAGALIWIAIANSSAMPGWTVLTALGAAGLTIAAGFRNLRLHRYYEGPRVAVVVGQSKPRGNARVKLPRS